MTIDTDPDSATIVRVGQCDLKPFPPCSLCGERTANAARIVRLVRPWAVKACRECTRRLVESRDAAQRKVRYWIDGPRETTVCAECLREALDVAEGRKIGDRGTR